MSIIREIFSDFVKASRLLGKEEELAAQISERLEELFPYKIGANGALCEWFEDFEPQEHGHRHFSHLIGVYPGEHLNPREEPKLFEAARAALRERLEPGDTGTGWSCVWAMALLARFGEGEQLAARLSDLLCKHTSPNLLDYMYVEGWPEPLVFQIDANLGACAAMTEMLASSRAGEIELLPALPAFWQSGAVRGLRVKGAASLSLAWKEGELCSAELTAQKGGTFCLRYAKGQLSVTLKAGERLSLSRKDFSQQ
jgi:alpha-L-fucosidase 2